MFAHPVAKLIFNLSKGEMSEKNMIKKFSTDIYIVVVVVVEESKT